MTNMIAGSAPSSSRGAMVAPPRNIVSLDSDSLKGVFSWLKLKEQRSLKRVCRAFRQEVTNCVGDYIVLNKLSAKTLQAVSGFFRKPRKQAANIKMENTIDVLMRMPEEVCASMTYLDCYSISYSASLEITARCPNLKKINLNPCGITSDVFCRIQQAYAQNDPPLEIVLLGPSVCYYLLEQLRDVVNPQSQPDDFSGIPLCYLKGVTEINLELGRVLFLPTDGEMIRAVGTLPPAALEQITSLSTFHHGGIGSPSSSLLTLIERFPLLRKLDLANYTITQDILRTLNEKESLKEAYLRISSRMRYDLVRADLTIHLHYFSPLNIYPVPFENLLRTVEDLFPQINPPYINLAPLARYCQKIRSLNFSREFCEEQFNSLMTLSLEIRNKVKYIEIHNSFAFKILRRNVFPMLETIDIHIAPDDRVSFGEDADREITHAKVDAFLCQHCPNLRSWMTNISVLGKRRYHV